MLKRLLSTLALFALLVPGAALAQTGTVAGTVFDAETDEALPGVNVALQELNRGSATNPDGEFRIEEVPQGTYTLVASFVGYQQFTRQITVEGGETIRQTIRLEPGEVGLEEIVVTAYGQRQQQNQITASVSQVDAEEIENLPTQNAEQLLQGRVPGVNIASSSGNPGSGFDVNIRGAGSIAGGNEPLYIVDGVQMSFNQGAGNTDTNPLNVLDPQNIESIRVLKDAAAAGIYGAQAANGVVLIETKQGRAGETQVSVTMEGGVRGTVANFDVLSPEEWRDFNVDAFNEVGDGETIFRQSFLPTFGYAPGTTFEETRKTDWRDFITRQGSHRNIGFSASGGGEDRQFFVSGSWTNTQSGVREVSFERWNLRTNLTQQFTPSFRVRTNFTISAGEEPGICQDGFFINCPWSGIQFEPPVTFPFNEDGTFNSFTTFGRSNNQAVVLEEENRPVNTTRLVGSLQPTYTITPWLSLQGSFGLDWQRINEVDLESTIADPGNAGSRFTRDNTITNMTLNSTLNYDQTFGDHDVTGLFGSEYRREFETQNDFGVGGFNQDLLTVEDAAAQSLAFGGFNTEFRLLSFFLSSTYTYDNRYTLQFSGRWDGASRFGANERFGFFPNVSASWRVTQEDFFDYDVVNDLKLRVNWGQTGNSEIGNFPARGLFSTDASFEGQVGLDPTQLANPALTWEEKQTWNLGIDYAFFSNRITGSVDLYQETTDELLLGRPLPRSSGFNDITENVGKVQNRGIEFQIETVNLRTESFRWSTRFNIGLNQNQVKDLNEGQESLASGAERPISVGHPIEGWKTPEWAGVNPADGRPMWLDENGNITYEPDDADDVFFDGASPDAQGGFGTTVGWKGLSMDAFFQYSYGGHTQPETIQFFLFSQGAFTAGHGLLTERWREPGDVTSIPRAVPNGNFPAADDFGTGSTFWLFDSSYLRFKNVRLSYSLPSSMLDPFGLRGARFYVSGTNLVTWTSFIGLDPEQADPEAESSFPNERQINVGVTLDI